MYIIGCLYVLTVNREFGGMAGLFFFLWGNIGFSLFEKHGVFCHTPGDINPTIPTATMSQGFGMQLNSFTHQLRRFPVAAESQKTEFKVSIQLYLESPISLVCLVYIPSA